MYYSNIKDCDIANGEGIRVSLFVSGCTNHCKNCFQPQTWDFNYGELFTEEVENKIFDMVNHNYVWGITILGGEPMEPKNQQEVMNFIDHFKQRFPDKTVWLYSGFTFERLLNFEEYCHTEITESLLRKIDVLVDGLFMEDLKNLSLKFRGSSNQRIIDVQKTFENKKITLMPIKDRKL